MIIKLHFSKSLCFFVLMILMEGLTVTVNLALAGFKLSAGTCALH